MLGNVNCGAAVFAAERETLHQPQRNQHDRRHDAPACVARQHADEERADTHQAHGDQEGIFAADHVAEPAEDQRAERTHREAGGEGEQREDEADIGRHIGEEVFRQEHAERAVDVEVVPFENGAERRSENDEALFARHAACAWRVHCHRGHRRSPPLLISLENAPAPR